jgi:translation initiation factor 3 subunit L
MSRAYTSGPTSAGAASNNIIDDSASDREEDALVDTFKEAVQYDDDDDRYDDDLGSGSGGGLGMASATGGPGGGSGAGGASTEDLGSRMRAAAEPLGYDASLETRFSSYDNYCTLFHLVLNSEKPVDVEMPSVCVWTTSFDMLRPLKGNQTS